MFMALYTQTQNYHLYRTYHRRNTNELFNTFQLYTNQLINIPRHLRQTTKKETHQCISH